MNTLIFLLPIFFSLIGIIILFRNVRKYLSAKNASNIYYRFLYTLILVLFYGSFIYYGILIFSLNGDLISDENLLGTLMTLSFPILGSSIGIGIFGKHLFEFIDFITSNKKAIFIKKILGVLLSLMIIASMNLLTIIGFLTSFNTIHQGLLSHGEFLATGVLIGFSGLGFGIAISIVASAILIYTQKLLEKYKNSALKKSIISITNALFFVLMYNIIGFSVVINYVTSYSMIGSKDITNQEYLQGSFALGITSLIITLLQSKLFYDYHTKKKSFIAIILLFIFIQFIFILVLIYGQKTLGIS